MPMLKTLASLPDPTALAEWAQATWDLPTPQGARWTTQLVRHRMACTHRLQMSPAPGKQNTPHDGFALRLEPATNHPSDNAEILLRTATLEALRQTPADASLPAFLKPTQPAASNALFHAELPCPEGPRLASLSPWVPGVAVAQNRSPEAAAKMGRSLAQLHAASRALPAPANNQHADKPNPIPIPTPPHPHLEFPTDLDRLLPLWWQVATDTPHGEPLPPTLDTPQGRVHFDAIKQQLAASQQTFADAQAPPALAKQPLVWCHGDVDASNVLLPTPTNNAAIAQPPIWLDWEHAGWGPPEADVASFLLETQLWAWPQKTASQTAFLTAYARESGDFRLDSAQLVAAAHWRVVSVLAKHTALAQRLGADHLSQRFVARLIGAISTACLKLPLLPQSTDIA